jgi:hypothetical protein
MDRSPIGLVPPEDLALAWKRELGSLASSLPSHRSEAAAASPRKPLGSHPSGSRMGLARIRRRVPPGRTGCVGVSSGMHVNRRLQCSIGGTGSSPHCERWGLGLACSSLPERVGWGSGWARRDSRRTAQSSERSPAAAWFPTRSRSSRDSEGRCWSPPHTHNKA